MSDYLKNVFDRLGKKYTKLRQENERLKAEVAKARLDLIYANNDNRWLKAELGEARGEREYWQQRSLSRSVLLNRAEGKLKQANECAGELLGVTRAIGNYLDGQGVPKEYNTLSRISLLADSIETDRALKLQEKDERIKELEGLLLGAQGERDKWHWCYDAYGEEGYDAVVEHAEKLNRLLEENLTQMKKQPPDIDWLENELKVANERNVKLGQQVLELRYIVEGMEMGKSYGQAKDYAETALQKK